MQNLLYEDNETMVLLGHQKASIFDYENFNKDIRNMYLAHTKYKEDAGAIVMDALMLGVIYGKRIERHRRKK